MQNKKSLLQRMLVIYITFFVVLLAGLAHSLLPNFSKGFHEGSMLGENIASSWVSGSPREIFLLGDIPLNQKLSYPIEGIDSTSDMRVTASVRNLELTVDQPAGPDANPMTLAFSAIGGSPWIYLLIMLSSLSYAAIVILMFIIIRSIRRSIKEETMLSGRNVWYIRTIGILTIFSELSHDLTEWLMKTHAAELLRGTGIAVDTTFTVSYSTIIMAILIIFTAEVFAIGQNLSEEQKLTI